MALIKCPDCTKDVSSSATSCIHCGAPLAARNAHDDRRDGKRVTTQMTSKSLKAQQLISTLMLVGGTAVSCTAASEGGSQPTVAPLVALVGLLWLLVTRFRIWWNHH